MADVFISYAQRAKEPTAQLAAALVGRGFDVWYDVNLLPGDRFGAVIMDEIDRATAVVTIWSRPALSSTWVPAESERAHGQGKLISVRTHDVGGEELPLPFNREHAPLYDAVDDLSAALQAKGVQPVGTDPESQSELDRLSVRATLIWQTVKDSRSAGAIQAFHDEFYSVKLFRELAKERLAALAAETSPAVAPALPRILTPDDVQLRLDPEMHVAPINRIGVTADAAMMVTGSDDKTAKLWSLPDGKLLRTLRPRIGPGDEGKVYAVAIDPQGKWVASGGCAEKGEAQYVSIFDTATGAVRQCLGPIPNVVLDLEVSPDGQKLAVGAASAGVRVYVRGEDGNFADTEWWDDCEADVYGVAFAGDGRVVSACFDGSIRLYGPDLQLRGEAASPGGNQPFSIAFSPDQSALAVGYHDGASVDVLDPDTLQPAFAVDVDGIAGGNLMCVAWRADGALVAGGQYRDENHTVFVWSDGGRGVRTSLPGPGNTIMQIIPAGDSLAYVSSHPAFGRFAVDGSSSLYRGPETADLRGKRGEHFLVSADGMRVRFGLKEWSKQPALFDLAEKTLAESAEAPADLSPPDTERLEVENWTNSPSPVLTVKKRIFGNTRKSLPMKQYENSRSLAIAPDGRRLVLGTDWYVRCFDGDGDEAWAREVPGVAWGVNLAREGRLVVVAYGDGTIRWHRAEDGAELLALFIHLPEGPEGRREWILFTPEGYYEASSHEAEKLIGWHVNNAEDEAADFYPAETFAKTFKRPDIIAQALDGV